MIKTIKIKKEMNFRELMEYIFKNNVAGETFASASRQDLEDKYVIVTPMGKLNFNKLTYNTGETYEVAVEEEITENTYLDHLVEVTKGDLIHTYQHDVTINEVLDEDSKVFYTLIDGELVKIWNRE